MSDEPEVHIPGFEIRRELGRGAMGVVYLAHERALGRDVALKVLRRGFAGDGDEARLRFEREVRATARLKHPGIVPILSTGEASGRLWFAMEFVPGSTLEVELEQSRHGRLGIARSARTVREVALALHAAHEAGVIHRDVKPGNVMLLEEEAPEAERSTPSRRLRRSWIRRRTGDDETPVVSRPLLADFGLAADRTASKLSESGMLIGTPGYMAPEQYRGRAEDVGAHSDQWALGVMLYECLTGNMPFPTADLPTLARMIGNDDPIPPGRLDTRIDRDLETIGLKCLQKNPRDR
ncbi:MAG: serine/threonine-protein kinase, partial [Planctomycetota bacterium]|nr:serine/threonine-protein kinase [Planctomycetota bacterium]